MACRDAGLGPGIHGTGGRYHTASVGRRLPGFLQTDKLYGYVCCDEKGFVGTGFMKSRLLPCACNEPSVLQPLHETIAKFVGVMVRGK